MNPDMNPETDPDTQILAFFNQVDVNAELRAKVLAVLQESAKETAEVLAQLSQKTDTPFTAEEFLALENTAKPGQELSDEHLAGVHGGIDLWTAGGAAVGLATTLAGATVIGKLGTTAMVMTKVLTRATPLTTAAGAFLGNLGGKIAKTFS